jgi:hypothetical protein
MIGMYYGMNLLFNIYMTDEGITYDEHLQQQPQNDFLDIKYKKK